jgi:allophanate hydrolase subunit 1
LEAPDTIKHCIGSSFGFYLLRGVWRNLSIPRKNRKRLKVRK